MTVYQVYETDVDYNDYPRGSETIIFTVNDKDAAKNIQHSQIVYNEIERPNRKIRVFIRELEVVII